MGFRWRGDAVLLVSVFFTPPADTPLWVGRVRGVFVRELALGRDTLLATIEGTACMGGREIARAPAQIYVGP